MKLIFYKEAAEHLHTTPDGIAHAVKRGALTKAGHKGKNSLLIEEQVLLFKGQRNGRKKWLALQDLTVSEKQEWERYAQAASQDRNQAPDIAVVNEVVARQLAPIQEALSEMASSTELSRSLRQQADEVEKEGYRKVFSVLRARAEKKAQAV